LNARPMKIEVFYLSALLIICLISPAQAQFERTAGKIVTDKKPGGIIETWNLEKSNLIEGKFFINEDWYVGDVRLYDGRVLEKVPLKYNLRDDLLHILDENKETRVIQFDKIAQFEWFNFEEKQNNHFVNCMDFQVKDTPMVGMAELVVEGKANLLVYRELEIQKGMYSVIHDAGNKNDEYIISEKYYIKLNDHMYLIKNKKSIEGIFGPRQEAVNKFIKANHFNLKKKEHLSEIAFYYNSL
jgi:hypothetical protein